PAAHRRRRDLGGPLRVPALGRRADPDRYRQRTGPRTLRLSHPRQLAWVRQNSTLRRYASRSIGTPEPPSSTPSALRRMVIGAIGGSSGSALYMPPTTPQSASSVVPSSASCPRLQRIAIR